MIDHLQHWDHDWFLAVNHVARQTPSLHGAMRVYAVYGVVLFAAALAVSWWLARLGRSPQPMAAALWAPVGALIALGLNQPLGNLVGEARPYTLFPHTLVLVARSQDFSFPSDHAVMAGAVTAGVLLNSRRLGVLTGLAALVLAFARVYVGAHFPLDVVAGLLFGAAVSTLGYLACRPLLVRAVTGLTRTPVRPLLTAGHRSAAR